MTDEFSRDEKVIMISPKGITGNPKTTTSRVAFEPES